MADMVTRLLKRLTGRVGKVRHAETRAGDGKRWTPVVFRDSLVTHQSILHHQQRSRHIRPLRTV